MRISFFALIVFLIPALSIASDVYYVDPDAPDGGNGRYDNPWNSAQQINAKTFSTGDGVYIKVNTTLRLVPGSHDQIRLRLDGTSTTQAVLGAYHSENQFGLRAGDNRPIILGTGVKDLGKGNNAPEGDHRHTVHYLGTVGYTTIRDLHIRDTYANGFGLSGPKGGTALQGMKLINCVVERAGRIALLVGRAHNTLIEGNYIDATSLRPVKTASGKLHRVGGAITITGNSNRTTCTNTIIRNNTLTRTGETIDIIRGARYTLIENNTIYDTAKVGLYLSNSTDSTVRGNLFYQPPYETSLRKVYWGQQDPSAIVIENEWTPGDETWPPRWIGYNTIYNNYIAGYKKGILISNESLTHWDLEPQRHNAIYGNRIVDCETGIHFNHISEKWEHNYIFDNYFYAYTIGMKHISHMSPSGVIWGVSATREKDGELKSTGQKAPNYFNTVIATATGNAANNAAFNQVTLKKTTGWRNLVPGEVTRALFEFTSEPKSPTGALEKVQNIQIAPITTKGD